MTSAITGPIHPLIHHIRQQAARRAAITANNKGTAQNIRNHHHARGTSDQSVYAIGGRKWKHIGPIEHHGQLATQHGYLVVNGRTSAEDIALALGGFDQAALSTAQELHRAARAAAPLIACALGVRIAAGNLQWDTGETVVEAALRLARDEAWHRHDGRNAARPRDLYATVAGYLGVGDVAEVAAGYLAGRDRIAEAVAELGIEWGGVLLDARQAAERARVMPPTWRSHVSRGEAPSSDGDGGWRVATVDAWRHSRPRTPVMDW